MVNEFSVELSYKTVPKKEAGICQVRVSTQDAGPGPGGQGEVRWTGFCPAEEVLHLRTALPWGGFMWMMEKWTLEATEEKAKECILLGHSLGFPRIKNVL